MDQQQYQVELIKRARSGDRDSLDELATMARERLRTYVYRLTQEDSLTQDIVQETLFEMCKALGKLKNNERFWPWLHGIATNKLKRFYRTERTQRNLAAASAQRKGEMAQRQDGLENLVSEELKGIVSAAMKKLRVRHKAVLIMRCYDGMTHSEIAESLGCSEFSTRMLFLRAKRALQRELCRNGFSKGALLAALAVFGKMTAPSKAAAAQISVTAAATKVGLLTEMAVLATTKTAIVSMTTAGVLTAGTIVAPSMLSKQDINPLVTSPKAVSFGINSDATEKFIYYYPDGPDKPMLLQATSGVAGTGSYRQVLQNEWANFDYRDNTLHINNHRMWAEDLSVPTLPTDDPGMTDFLAEVVPGTIVVDRVARGGKHLEVTDFRNEADEIRRPVASRNYHVVDEDYFQPDPPTTTRTVDNRDQMHRRGWTYFRIRGQINGEKVFGSGRIPFVHMAGKEHSPWLKLKVGSLTIVDSDGQAQVSEGSADQIETYRSGSFFTGLGRPWMGLHALDTVRRDAAAQRIWFKTEHLPDGKFAQVELECGGAKLVYTIDLETDVIDKIAFSTDKGETGSLTFSYLQSIDGVGREFARPSSLGRRTSPKSSP
ncbi:MAG: RNA polymerase sigma factor, partial [Planctomycetota bacterium]